MSSGASLFSVFTEIAYSDSDCSTFSYPGSFLRILSVYPIFLAPNLRNLNWSISLRFCVSYIRISRKHCKILRILTPEQLKVAPILQMIKAGFLRK